MEERIRFAEKCNRIQTTAHLLASQHKELMKAAMESQRNIDMLDLPDICFV